MERYPENRDLLEEKERLRERALAYGDIGMHKEATAEYEKIIELDRADPWSYIDLILSLQDNGEIDKAMEGYRKVLKIFPNNPNLYIDLGRCFEKHFKRIDRYFPVSIPKRKLFRS
jgi:tetratricopeptide (TPR) repeat protein